MGEAIDEAHMEAHMISFVFPAFNEAENIRRFSEEVIPEFDRLGLPYEIVIVNDGSIDATPEVASSLGGPVRLVNHDRNRGLGAAVRTGIHEAKGDLIVTMDSDLTFSPKLVSSLLERFNAGGVDVVSGSPKLAGYGKDIPSYRIVIGKCSTIVYSLLLGRNITAVSPIFRLYRRSDLADLDLQSTGFDINAEILFRLIQNGKRIAEVPAELTQRQFGDSKLNYVNEMKRHLRLIRRMAAWRLGLHRDTTS
jgi:dolichol-phosphate mannosyltransferase